MTIKNCIVLDDEQHSIDILTDYIAKTPNLNLIGAYKNPIDALQIIQTKEIDIAFLDVQMPNISGLQFTKLLNKNTKVVLCTAYATYAIDGYELNVLDYLLKPISYDRFLKSILKISENIGQNIQTKAPDFDNEFIFVKADAKGKFIKVKLNDICYIEGLGNYQKIKLADTQIVCQLKMKNLEEQLSQYDFVRVHKSFLVPVNKINQIEGNKILIGLDKIPIGESFKEELFEKLKGRILI